MIKLLAVSLIATLLSLGSLNVDTNRATRTIKEEQPISRTVNVFSEPFDEEHVVFHYHRSDGNYTSWDLWVWGQNEEGFDFDYTGEDDYGKYGFLPLSTFNDTSQVNFIIRPGGWTQQTGDINVQFADFTLQADQAYHLYLVNLEENVYHSPEAVTAGRVLDAKFISASEIYLATNIDSATYTLKLNGNGFANGPTNDVYNEDTYRFESDITIPNTHDIDLQGQYAITVSFTDSNHEDVTAEISLSGLFDDPLFVEELTYDGNDLGATYTSSRTSFKAWAPTTTSLKLRLYDNGTPTLIDNSIGDDTFSEYAYIKGDKGVWTVSVDGDLHGKYYTLVATNGAGTNEFVDPYARAAGVNGLRGMIVDFSKTNPEGWDEVDFSVKKPTEIIPYELHIADLTADDTWNGQEANRKRFLGLIEEGTTYTEGDVTVSTGFDHIKELGVNAIQIMPFYDQSNYEINRKAPILDEEGNPVLGEDNKPLQETVIPGHNWGYNPLNFNVLEGQYSSNPYLGEVRVQEFKQVVEAYANHDIRVIMDVVYNHVASASSSNFQKIVPGYYFRFNQDWSLNNDSGVGNVFASENPMAAKFIVDSVLFWAEEFNIKGFRFDLMELIADSTMIALEEALVAHGLHDVVIWGEPWNAAGGYSGGYKVNRGTLANTRVAAFNDQGRNGLKGENSIRHNSHWGWINKGVADNVEQPYINKVKGMLAGIHGSYYDDNGNFDSKFNNNPSKAVNYAGSHDNFALFDQMLFSFGGNETMAMRAATAANAMILSGQGIPFFQGGDEIGRTKPFDETSEIGAAFVETHFYESAELGDQFYSGNSYNIGYETNSYKWNDKIKWLPYFNAYKDLINLRLSEAGEFMRLASASEVGNNFRFWQDMIPALSWSAVASENKFNASSYTSSGAIYGFYVARIAENDVTKETFKWSADGAQVKVIYDSKGELTGQILTEQVAMERFRVILVERL